MKDFFEKYQKILKNCGWLYLIQLANYVFPLLVIPYLLRTVGVEKYGIVVMSQAVMMYINVVVDYGFNLTAVRQITACKDGHEQVRKIFNDIMIVKICIVLICLFFYSVAVFCFPMTQEIRVFLFLSYLFVIGSAFFPIWFFQGMEDMKYITFANLISRLLYLLLLIILVKEINDYIWIIFLQGIGTVLSSLFALYVINKKYNIHIYEVPSWADIKKILNEGWPVFIANACGNIYSQGAILITGMIAGQAAAAYYSLGQKVSGTIANLVQPFVQSVYPYICKLYLEEKKVFYDFFYKLLRIAIILNILLAIFTIALAKQFSLFLQGEMDLVLVYVIQIFAAVTFGTLLNVLLHPFVLAMKMYHFIQKIYFRVSIIFLCISLLLVQSFNVYGMVISLMIVEYFILSNYLKIIFKERNDLVNNS